MSSKASYIKVQCRLCRRGLVSNSESGAIFKPASKVAIASSYRFNACKAHPLRLKPLAHVGCMLMHALPSINAFSGSPFFKCAADRLETKTWLVGSFSMAIVYHAIAWSYCFFFKQALPLVLQSSADAFLVRSAFVGIFDNSSFLVPRGFRGPLSYVSWEGRNQPNGPPLSFLLLLVQYFLLAHQFFHPLYCVVVLVSSASLSYC